MSKKEIQELMTRKGWSQADLARKLGMFESTISRWLRGQTKPVGPKKNQLRQMLDEVRAAKKKQAS